MTESKPPNLAGADHALAYAILRAVLVSDAPARHWDSLDPEDRARWLAVARTTAVALDELSATLNDASAPRTSANRLEARLRVLLGARPGEDAATAAMRTLAELERWRGGPSRIIIVTGNTAAVIEEQVRTIVDREIALWPELEDGRPLHPLQVSLRTRQLCVVSRDPIAIGTMSEVAVSRVGHAVASKMLAPDEAKVWLCSDGMVTKHPFDAKGILRRWPFGFFRACDDHYDETPENRFDEDGEDDSGE